MTLRSRPDRLDGILVIPDERRDADEIAFEMRRKGHQVDVQELMSPLPVPGGPTPLVHHAVHAAPVSDA